MQENTFQGPETLLNNAFKMAMIQYAIFRAKGRFEHYLSYTPGDICKCFKQFYDFLFEYQSAFVITFRNIFKLAI